MSLLARTEHQNENHNNWRALMEKWVCTICGYVYDPAEGDPDHGIAPGTAWEDVPNDWICPICGAAKDDFEKEG
jgi:rubredoxin